MLSKSNLSSRIDVLSFVITENMKYDELIQKEFSYTPSLAMVVNPLVKAALEIAKKITGDENAKIVQDNIVPVYECDCSKESMANGLASIGKKELEEIIQKEGKAELICHFCNKKYQFSKEELEEIYYNLNN